MEFKLTKPYERGAGLDTGRDIWQLMSMLNAWNVGPLVNYQSRTHGEDGERCVQPDSVYGHLEEALKAVMRQLGADPEKAYVALQEGCSFREAVEAHKSETL
ncbi:hypothetical protein [Streptomyces sp. 5-10]|uniref:hypothetical protein n=1 Tax=Streptomyces sp. 5-10 TaxID=878925 RepID=UPI00168B4B7D|nr:hypothetical protein [Streptomyces sp. 5-10]MBD3004682.1 hypothetical protein [Streptomyces sp. 5-10]